MHLRHKAACKSCGDGVVTAPPADKVIEGGLPGPGLLAEVLVGKYRDHLPLQRQVGRFKRLGVDLARSTLSDWVGHAAEALQPVAGAIRQAALSSHVLQTDGTGLRVLDRDKASGTRRGSLYCHVGDDEHVFFDYQPDESHEGARAAPVGRRGWIVADGHPAYDPLFDGPDATAVEAGCWMHCRRYYKKALDAGDLRAAVAIKIIKDFYKLEAQAKQARAGPVEILRMRQEQTLPRLNELGAWIAKMYDDEPPKTPLARAMGYTVRQWDALLRFVEDPALPPDNGAPERAIRAVAVGRRNWLFAGSDAGGRRAAVMYTLLGSCAAVGAEPWEFMRDVLHKLAAGWPHRRLAELMPGASLAARPQPGPRTEDEPSAA